MIIVVAFVQNYTNAISTLTQLGSVQVVSLSKTPPKMHNFAVRTSQCAHDARVHDDGYRRKKVHVETKGYALKDEDEDDENQDGDDAEDQRRRDKSHFGYSS